MFPPPRPTHQTSRYLNIYFSLYTVKLFFSCFKDETEHILRTNPDQNMTVFLLSCPAWVADGKHLIFYCWPFLHICHCGTRLQLKDLVHKVDDEQKRPNTFEQFIWWKARITNVWHFSILIVSCLAFNISFE